MILRFPGSSQLFFFGGVIPYISLAAACGLATIFRERITPGFRVALLSTAGGGVVAFLAVRVLRGLPISFPRTTGVAAPMTGGRLAQPG